MDRNYRHLIFLNGNQHILNEQLEKIVETFTGDWVILTDDPHLQFSSTHHYSTQQSRLLLGQEFKHAIFDARTSFNLDAFAILSGSLISGSRLIVLLPYDFENWQDADSLRWNESTKAIAVPHFILHLKETIKKQKLNFPNYTDSITLTENNQTAFNSISAMKKVSSELVQPDFYSLQEQQNVLNQILNVKTKIISITAKRGRGKSALAGMFTHHHRCIVTAPNRNSINTLMRFSKKNTIFHAPDELIELIHSSISFPDWLIIDEAAMIPLPMLKILITNFKRILLTSTIDGYEGTGQGLLLKLFEQYQSKNEISLFQLATPIRWLDNDPLEHFAEQLTIAQTNQKDILFPKSIQGVEIKKILQHDLVASGNRLQKAFHLLKTAHYRTTLTDLRRLLDADNLDLYCAENQNDQLIGIAIVVKEGGLSSELCESILKGYRRPKGNLVAQSLVAHAGNLQAGQLKSTRINRIAVTKTLRRKGIAQSILLEIIEQAKSNYDDFVSVSFSYDSDLLKFWQKIGFQIVHVGTHQEASSASNAVMAIYPISSNGIKLCQELTEKLNRNWFWLKNKIKIDLPISITDNQQLNKQDINELILFATTSYAYSASFAVLYRLANSLKSSNQMPLLQHLAKHDFNESLTIKIHNLSGKKELLKQLRKEVHQFLNINFLKNKL